MEPALEPARLGEPGPPSHSGAFGSLRPATLPPPRRPYRPPPARSGPGARSSCRSPCWWWPGQPERGRPEGSRGRWLPAPGGLARVPRSATASQWPLAAEMLRYSRAGAVHDGDHGVDAAVVVEIREGRAMVHGRFLEVRPRRGRDVLEAPPPPGFGTRRWAVPRRGRCSAPWRGSGRGKRTGPASRHCRNRTSPGSTR